VTFLQGLLWPLSLAYGAAAHLRARAYRTGLLHPRRLEGVVISVGNLTTGGTGKTPMVLWIAHRLLAEEKSPGILTRGYGGRGDAENSTSDEVRLLRAHLGDRATFGVGADRFAHGSELARRGVQWFILDDGFQHLQLTRDVDIVLIDALNPFGGGHLLPAGRLREPRSALARADIVVITRSDHAPALQAAIRHESDAPIFYARPHLESIRLFRGEYPGTEAPQCHAQKLFAFSGIGNPAALRADLREWGFQIVGYKVFPDHHRYTPDDVRAIQAQARDAGADGAICTEKDIFNLSGVEWGDFDLYYCGIAMHVAHEDAFWRTVKALADSRKPPAKRAP
jgi:tetraacyldisaccharide 4'-kinase